MKNHVKVYFEYFGFAQGDFVPCEFCGRKAVDIQHIDARGMGGSKQRDHIENLMASCRENHITFGDRKEFKHRIKELHMVYMLTSEVHNLSCIDSNSIFK